MTPRPRSTVRATQQRCSACQTVIPPFRLMFLAPTGRRMLCATCAPIDDPDDTPTAA